jgi:hypothetical protein
LPALEADVPVIEVLRKEALLRTFSMRLRVGMRQHAHDVYFQQFSHDVFCRMHTNLMFVTIVVKNLNKKCNRCLVGKSSTMKIYGEAEYLFVITDPTDTRRSCGDNGGGWGRISQRKRCSNVDQQER